MSRVLSKDEVQYIRCALDWQVDNDDDSELPPRAAGESAYDKFLSLNASEDRKVVLFSWNIDKGECYECGLPAAYHAATSFPHGDAAGLRCCVCAAQAAADGEVIEYLYRDDR